MGWSLGQQQEGSITESSQQGHREPFLTGKLCGATFWLCPAGAPRTERPDVSWSGSCGWWSTLLPQWGGCSQFRRDVVLSLRWQTPGKALSTECRAALPVPAHKFPAEEVATGLSIAENGNDIQASHTGRRFDDLCKLSWSCLTFRRMVQLAGLGFMLTWCC